jgi:hypothetical protein
MNNLPPLTLTSSLLQPHDTRESSLEDLPLDRISTASDNRGYKRRTKSPLYGQTLIATRIWDAINPPLLHQPNSGIMEDQQHLLHRINGKVRLHSTRINRDYDILLRNTFNWQPCQFVPTIHSSSCARTHSLYFQVKIWLASEFRKSIQQRQIQTS